VNLGGWLNTEPFISPALFEKYNSGGQALAVDEWTLSELMASDTAGGGLQTLMEEHYKTFIVSPYSPNSTPRLTTFQTEEDFAAIAAAGLNWVRIPLPYWAIEVWDGEPFLPKVSWKYFLKAIKWARKYGLRINLDLHAVPGSQNSWNHSGRLGHGPNFMAGVMGIANAQRTMDYIR
jgi:glucan 1,3-beta-glucosidase